MGTIIKTVDGVDCPTPSEYTWGLSDSSASDAGRVQDGNDTMYKNRTSQKRKLTLKWNAPSPEKTSQILKMFNPEYISVQYLDAMSNQVETRTFYVGDRSAPLTCYTVNHKIYSSVSFDIIER